MASFLLWVIGLFESDAVDQAKEISINLTQANQVLLVELLGQIAEHGFTWNHLAALIQRRSLAHFLCKRILRILVT